MQKNLFVLLIGLNFLITNALPAQIIHDTDNFHIFDTLVLNVDQHTKWNKGLIECDSLTYCKFFKETKIDNLLRTPEQQLYLDNGHDAPKAFYYSYHHISGNFETIGLLKISGFTELYIFTINPEGDIIDYVMVSKYNWLWSKTVQSHSVFISKDSLVTYESSSLKDTVICSHKILANGQIETAVIHETYEPHQIPSNLASLFLYKDVREFDMENNVPVCYPDTIFNKATDQFFEVNHESVNDYFLPFGNYFNLVSYNVLPHNKKMLCFSWFTEVSGIDVHGYIFNQNDRLIGVILLSTAWGDQGDWGNGKGYFANDSTYIYNYKGGYNDGMGSYFEENFEEKYIITNSDLIYYFKNGEVKLVEDLEKE